jgi:multimeric flavodoxin WrbA
MSPGGTMKVLAFNASPRKQHGTTDIVLNYFLEGARQAGASTKKYYVTDLEIKGCIGCFTCWTKTPGKCIHRDDMDWLIPESQEADVIVLGTPIYNGNIIHYLQRMTERFLPTQLPWMEERGENTQHPPRYRKKQQKIVLVAVAGFPDHQAFNIVKAISPDSLHILLPSSQILQDPEGAELMKDFTDAVTESAKQLIQHGTVDQKTKNKLVVEYSPEMKKMIREHANKHFEAQLKK